MRHESGDEVKETRKLKLEKKNSYNMVFLSFAL